MELSVNDDKVDMGMTWRNLHNPSASCEPCVSVSDGA